MADHWLLVATDYVGTDAWVVHISTDTINDFGFDFPGQSLEEYGLSIQWLEQNPPGLYRLTVQDDSNDDVSIKTIECLFLYPQITVAVRSEGFASSIVSDYAAIARGLQRLRDQRRT